jgi:hypothetical protein
MTPRDDVIVFNLQYDIWKSGDATNMRGVRGVVGRRNDVREVQRDIPDLGNHGPCELVLVQ